MNRRYVGIILVACAVLFSILTYAHLQDKLRLNGMLHEDCNLPEAVCPFTNKLPEEYMAGFGIAAVAGVVGAYDIFSSRNAKLQQTRRKEDASDAVKSLDEDERKIYSMIEGTGAIFQSELVEKSGLPKVRITRILDRLESRGLVERRRRGMTNIVMLKQQ